MVSYWLPIINQMRGGVQKSRIFSNIFKRFTQLFERFQSFSNVFNRFQKELAHLVRKSALLIEILTHLRINLRCDMPPSIPPYNLISSPTGCLCKSVSHKTLALHRRLWRSLIQVSFSGRPLSAYPFYLLLSDGPSRLFHCSDLP